MFNEVVVSKKQIFSIIKKGNNNIRLCNEWFNKLWSNDNYEIYLITSYEGLIGIHKKLNQEIIEKDIRRQLITKIYDYEINIPRCIIVEKNDSLFIQDKKIIASNLFKDDNVHTLYSFKPSLEFLQLSFIMTNICGIKPNYAFKGIIKQLLPKWLKCDTVAIYDYLLDKELLDYSDIYHVSRFPARIRHLFKKRFINNPYPLLKALNKENGESDNLNSVLNKFGIDFQTLKQVVSNDIKVIDYIPKLLVNQITDRDFYYENIDRYPEIGAYYTHKLTSLSEYYKIIESNPNNIRFFSHNKDILDLWIRAIQLNPDCIKYIDTYNIKLIIDKLDVNKSNIQYLFKYLSSEKKTKDHILYMIENYKIMYNDIPKTILDTEIKKLIIKNIWHNTSLALECVSDDISMIDLLIQEIKKDYSIFERFYINGNFSFYNEIIKRIDFEGQKQFIKLFPNFVEYISQENMTTELYDIARGMNIKPVYIKGKSKEKKQLFEEELFFWNHDNAIEKYREIITRIMQIHEEINHIKR